MICRYMDMANYIQNHTSHWNYTSNWKNVGDSNNSITLMLALLCPLPKKSKFLMTITTMFFQGSILQVRLRKTACRIFR